MNTYLMFNETIVQHLKLLLLFGIVVGPRLEELSNSQNPRDLFVRNPVCAVSGGTPAIEGRWLKTSLKRSSLNNAIDLMSFAGQWKREGRNSFTKRFGKITFRWIFPTPDNCSANHDSEICGTRLALLDAIHRQ